MDDRDERPAPLTEDRDGPLAREGWHAGATFFEESGGRPASAAGDRQGSGQGAGGGDPHLPASESGTGIIPEDQGGAAEDVSRPASEEDTGPLQNEDHGEPQSWPGRGGPGTFPPPG